jgi:hypothetical protein
LFEFTGAKPPKSKSKFTKADEDRFCFAGEKPGDKARSRAE